MDEREDDAPFEVTPQEESSAFPLEMLMPKKETQQVNSDFI